MIAAVVEGRFAYFLSLGMVAAINPCGFAMLPAYLMYFLGLEGTRVGSQRASIVRALIVSVSTSAGFIAVFLVVGTIARLFTNSLVDNAKYVSLVIGVALIVFGCFMLAGWRPKFAMLQIGQGQERTQTVRSMFGFGVAYAVASLGCTIPLFINVIFGTFATKGFASGVVSTTLYGVGMGLTVTGLTVTLAFASGGLLRVLRSAMRYLDLVAAVFLIVTGMYLTWFWYSAITEQGADGLKSRAERWQVSVQDSIARFGYVRFAGILAIPVALGVVYLLVTRRRREAEH